VTGALDDRAHVRAAGLQECVDVDPDLDDVAQRLLKVALRGSPNGE
jgi:hypothetical protein